MGLRPRSVTLRVPNLEESLKFYRDALGLKVLEESSGEARLSASGEPPPVVLLEEAGGASPEPTNGPGLFHLALRVPGRADLARAFDGLRAAGIPLEGASDHGVSEALYLADPHQNGVEIYADRPRSSWEWRDGEIQMVTRALNLTDLLTETSEEDGPLLARETELGHVHLRVTDLERAEVFYGRVLGLEVTTRSYPGAIFFAADGYHHHLAVNVWGTRRGASRPPGALGLAEVSMTTEEQDSLTRAVGLAEEKGLTAEPFERGAVFTDGDGIRLRVEMAKVP